MSLIKKFTLGLAMLMMTGMGSAAVQTNEKAPDFSITDTKGKTQSLSAYKGQYVVLEWFNFGCPFVKKHYDSGNMQSLQDKWTTQKVVWLSICSSAKGKEGSLPADETNNKMIEKKTKGTAVILDSEGKLGKLYGAKTTPHMFVINPDRVLIYQGAIDNKPSTDIEDIKGAHNYVDAALIQAMAGKKVTDATTTSYGCSVKY